MFVDFERMIFLLFSHGKFSCEKKIQRIVCSVFDWYGASRSRRQRMFLIDIFPQQELVDCHLPKKRRYEELNGEKSWRGEFRHTLMSFGELNEMK